LGNRVFKAKTNFLEKITFSSFSQKCVLAIFRVIIKNKKNQRSTFGIFYQTH